MKRLKLWKKFAERDFVCGVLGCEEEVYMEKREEGREKREERDREKEGETKKQKVLYYIANL